MLFNDEMKEAISSGILDLVKSPKRLNPESNANKFIQQNRRIGQPRDFTMDLLNRYATYGANTGIGNLGGSRLVKGLNEQYRDRIDAQLPQNRSSIGMEVGGLPISPEMLSPEMPPFEMPPFEIEADAIPSAPSDQILDEEAIETINSPFEEVEAPLLFKIKEWLAKEDNMAKVKAGGASLKTIIQALMIEDDAKKAAPVARYRGPSPHPIRPQFIGEKGRGYSDRDIAAYRRAHAADGGKVSRGSPILNRKMFLGGGEIDGPGGPKEDMVPIWASDQEYVVSADAVKKLGGGNHARGIATLDKINFGR